MMAGQKEYQMARVAVVVAALMASVFAGCEAEQPRTVHKSSIEQQFAQLNKGGWSVESAETREKKAKTPTSDMRVVKEADFSNLQVRTNFQIDDPKLRAQQEKQQQEEAAKRPPVPDSGAPAAMPFGTLMPGR
jgi:hypothetical protein